MIVYMKFIGLHKFEMSITWVWHILNHKFVR